MPSTTMTRLVDPVTSRIAGSRFFPAWARVQHVGRRTGRELTVPVVVQPGPGVFVINLPWGPRTNWVRNVQHAGGCVVRWKGVEYPMTAPELLDEDQARPYYGRVAWAVARRFFPADAWLLLRHQRP
jgi:deazaflavin-dependent oxidoreductase (nitroreductase family)